jgi:hypothetical protein
VQRKPDNRKSNGVVRGIAEKIERISAQAN